MNSNIFFLVTGYLIALEASNDKNHTRAKNHWQNLIRSRPSLVTTSFVFDEVVTFFNSRNRHDKAVEVGSRLLNSPSIQLIQINKGIISRCCVRAGRSRRVAWRLLRTLPARPPLANAP